MTKFAYAALLMVATHCLDGAHAMPQFNIGFPRLPQRFPNFPAGAIPNKDAIQQISNKIRDQLKNKVAIPIQDQINKNKDANKDNNKNVPPPPPAENNNNNNNKNVQENDADAAARGQQFCSSQFPQLALADGTQNRGGSCSLTVQGAIPSFDRMVSTIITAPQNGAQIPVDQQFDLAVRTNNMALGNFDNPQQQYYRTPQTLNGDGEIIGHQHVVIQSMGSENPDQPLDARTFEFFRGLDFQPAPGNVLSVTVPAGQIRTRGPARICTITGTRGHQPVIMPVAQRGSQDDCIRVTFV